MLLKTTIKLILVSIWIAIFNLLTFHSLEFFQNENFLSLGETAKSLSYVFEYMEDIGKNCKTN